MMHHEYGAVLLTFGRNETLIEYLVAVLAAEPPGMRQILVVDNNPDASACHLIEDNRDRLAISPIDITVVAAGANLGAAGGWGRGLCHMAASADAPFWMLLLDDDDPLPSWDLPSLLISQFQELELSHPDFAAQVAAIGIGGKTYARHWLEDPQGRPRPGGWRAVDALDSGVAAMYRSDYVRLHGSFREDLFFCFEELELGKNMQRLGWVLLESAVLRDRLDAELFRRYVEKKGKPPSRWVVREPTWRTYFALRNSIFIIRVHGGLGWAIAHAVVRGLAKPLVHLPRAPRQASRLLVTNMRAVRDGLLGRLGPR